MCPPPPSADGAWRTEVSHDGCEARFHGVAGDLLGFAVLEAATARKQALAAQVPGLLQPVAAHPAASAQAV